MKRSITTAVVGVLVVIASACGDTTSAEPANPAPGTDAPPPETDVPPPVTPTPAPQPEPTVPVPPATDAPKPTLPAPPTTVAPKPTVPLPPPTVAPKPTVPVPPTTIAPKPPPAEQPPPNGAACLVGEWVVADDELKRYFATVADHAGFESIVSIGVVRLSFTNTTFTWVNDYALSMTVAGTTYESVLSGGISGTYRESDSVIQGTVDHDGRTGTITQGGEPVGDVGDLFSGINPSQPMDGLLFTCTGPALMVQAGPLVGARRAVTLTPA